MKRLYLIFIYSIYCLFHTQAQTTLDSIPTSNNAVDTYLNTYVKITLVDHSEFEGFVISEQSNELTLKTAYIIKSIRKSSIVNIQKINNFHEVNINKFYQQEYETKPKKTVLNYQFPCTNILNNALPLVKNKGYISWHDIYLFNISYGISNSISIEFKTMFFILNLAEIKYSFPVNSYVYLSASLIDVIGLNPDGVGNKYKNNFIFKFQSSIGNYRNNFNFGFIQFYKSGITYVCPLVNGEIKLHPKVGIGIEAIEVSNSSPKQWDLKSFQVQSAVLKYYGERKLYSAGIYQFTSKLYNVSQNWSYPIPYFAIHWPIGYKQKDK